MLQRLTRLTFCGSWMKVFSTISFMKWFTSFPASTCEKSRT
jgi:hypothetical protein